MSIHNIYKITYGLYNIYKYSTKNIILFIIINTKLLNALSQYKRLNIGDCNNLIQFLVILKCPFTAVYEIQVRPCAGIVLVIIGVVVLLIWIAFPSSSDAPSSFSYRQEETLEVVRRILEEVPLIDG